MLLKIDRALLDQMRCERWEPDQAFKDISVDLLDPSAWKRFDHKCFYKDAIHNLEARTLAKFCDRLGNMSNYMELKVLILGDSLAVMLAYARRRAKDFHLLTQIPRMSAVGLVKGIKISFPWIPFELNVTDFDSRKYGTVRSSSHQAETMSV